MNDVDDTSSVPEAVSGGDPAMSSPLPEERALTTMLEVTDESSPETFEKSNVLKDKKVVDSGNVDDSNNEDDVDDDMSVVNWDWGKDGDDNNDDDDDNTSVGSSNISSSQSLSKQKSGSHFDDNDSDSGDDATVVMDREEEKEDKENGGLEIDSPMKSTVTEKEESEADKVMKVAALKATKDAATTDDSTMSPATESPSSVPAKKKTRTYGKSDDTSSSSAAPPSLYLSPFRQTNNADEQPEKERLLLSTERIFSKLDSYDNVSVIDIIRRLEPEYGVAFSKATVRVVKQHIKSLLLKRLAEEEEEESEQEFGDDGDVDVDEASKPNSSKTVGSFSNNLDTAFSETMDDADDEKEDKVVNNKNGSESDPETKKTVTSDLDDEDDSDDEFPSNDDWETQPRETRNVLTSRKKKKDSPKNDSESEVELDDDSDANDGLETQDLNTKKVADEANSESEDSPEGEGTEESMINRNKDNETPMPEEMDQEDNDMSGDVEMENAEDGKSAKDGANETAKSDSPSADVESSPTSGSRRSSRIKIVKTQPSEDALLVSVDHLFLQVENKETVTVKDIVKALQVEFDVELTKASKKFVRGRLTDLITGEEEPSIEEEDADGDDENEDSDAEISDQGDSESDESAYEDKKRTRKGKKKTTSRRKGDASKKAPRSKKPKVERPNKRAAAKAARAARLLQVERLKKKRMEELRVRQEEMQLTQSKEDQEREERIRAKFDTDTEELRLRRLEGRLTLLQQLDKKRIHVIEVGKNDADKIDAKSSQVGAKEEKSDATVSSPNGDKVDNHDGDDSDSESESDEELVIVGASKPFKPLPRLHNQNEKSKLALSILDRGVDHTAKKPEAATKKENKWVSDKPFMSPNKSLGARAALRNALRKKQREMGNMWLARELGYKNETEHVKDCLTVAHKKRDEVIKMEQLRLQANERKQLRERLMLQDQQVDDETADPEGESELAEGQPDTETAEEEDEEMKLAKEIERESQDVESSPSQPDAVEAVHSSEEKNEDRYDLGSPCEPTDKPMETQKPLDESEGSKDAATDKLLNASQGADVVDDEMLDQLETQPPPKIEVEAKLADTPEPEGTDTRVVSTDTSQLTDSQESTVEEETEKDAPLSTEDSESSDAPASAPKTTDALVDSDNDEDEREFSDDSPTQATSKDEEKDQNKPRNAAWQAMLQKDAEKAKKLKKRKGVDNLVEAEAEEEEEEEVAGLEDFGFKISKKKEEDDEEGAVDDGLDEEDLKHVVDDVSDNEGDEEAGEAARKRLELKEEKERHKEILRRMREGYDGRRGGIAGGGVGARGMHRFDQLVAADNREDAKRLGLLNDDELDSDDEDGKDKNDDEEDDEAALLDKMLKDRFLHRSSIDAIEEDFSSDEEPDDEEKDEKGENSDDEEERTQERLAKRFAKRARMQRLVELHGESQEFSQQRLIDEDESMKLELSKMKNGLVRRRSVSSASRSSFGSANDSGSQSSKRRGSLTFGGPFMNKGGSLSIALQASRKKSKHRTSFLGGSKASSAKENVGGLIHKSISLSHVVFRACDSQVSSRSNMSNGANATGKRSSDSSLLGKVVGKSQNKRVRSA